MTLAIGMWVHAYLAASVVMEHGRTRNPIWCELRMCLAVVTVTSLWVGLGIVTKGTLQ